MEIKLSAYSIASYKGKGFVCFLDILGFKNALYNHFENNFQLIEAVIGFNRRFAPDDLRGIPEEHRKPIFEGSARLFLFSDSYTICIRSDTPMGLIGMVSHISYIWKALIELGFSIRGGIDFDDAYWDERTVTGPALVNAYKLESDCAKNSRVVVSSNLNRYIFNLLTIDNIHEMHEDQICRYFCRDIDGMIIVNPQTMCDYKMDGDMVTKEPDSAELVRQIKEIQHNAPAGTKEKCVPLIAMLESKAILTPKDAFGKY